MSDDEDLSIIDLARRETYVEKLQVAGLRTIEPEVLEVLLADPDSRVFRATLQNTRVSTEMLRNLVNARREFTEPAARHVNAPPELMGADIIWHLGAESVERFLHHKAATDAQRTAFIREYHRAGEQPATVVAEAWNRVEREV